MRTCEECGLVYDDVVCPDCDAETYKAWVADPYLDARLEDQAMDEVTFADYDEPLTEYEMRLNRCDY